MFSRLANNNVPIIGEPFTLKTWTATAVIVCNCPGKEPVLLAGTTIGQCPACQQSFQVQGMIVDPRTGQISFQIGMLRQPDGEKPAS